MGVISICISGEPEDVEAATAYLLGEETIAPRTVLYCSDNPSCFPGFSTKLVRFLEIEIQGVAEDVREKEHPVQ